MISSAQLSDRIRPLRRVEYEQLVDAGHLANEKVELIRGLIVRMSPQGPRHAAAIQKLSKSLIAALDLPGRASVRVQLPLALGEASEPEPDLAVVPTGTYEDQHPTSALLVVEVADRSLTQDRRDKAVLYAEHGIPEYWIVDTANRRVEVYSDVVEGGYSRVTPYRKGEVLGSSVFPELQLRIDELFP